MPAFRGRVLLYAGQWAEAASAAKKVIVAKTYTLFPDYRGLSYLENECNAEIVFDVQFRFPEFTHSLDIGQSNKYPMSILP